jgi:hypothetical protein
VLDAPRPQRDVVEAVVVQLAPGDDVRQPQSTKAPVRAPAAANGVLLHELPVLGFELAAVVVLVPRAWNVVDEAPPDVIDLGIGDPIGIDHVAELD